MRSAEDWLTEVHDKPFLLDSENREWIQAIQLDAFIAGERFAAGIVHDYDLRQAGISISSAQITQGEQPILADVSARTSLPEEKI